MKLKALGLAAVAAMAFTAFAASSAAATTLEIDGVTRNSAVTIEASLKSGTSAILSRTDGSLPNTCTVSTLKGTTNVFTGSTVTLPLSHLLFSNCERPVTVLKAGTVHIAHIAGTTNGTVSSSGAEVTVGSAFGTLNCKTGTGAHLGTLNGTAGNHAELHINGVLSCGVLVPTFRWTGTYIITSPTRLGVSP